MTEPNETSGLQWSFGWSLEAVRYVILYWLLHTCNLCHMVLYFSSCQHPWWPRDKGFLQAWIFRGNSHHPDAYDINIMWIAPDTRFDSSHEKSNKSKTQIIRHKLPRFQSYPFRTKVNNPHFRVRVVPRCRSAQMESLCTGVSYGTYLAEKIHRTILIFYTL